MQFGSKALVKDPIGWAMNLDVAELRLHSIWIGFGLDLDWLWIIGFELALD